MFGKDTYEPSEYPYYWRVFETKDEYFDYYRGYHGNQTDGKEKLNKLATVDVPPEAFFEILKTR